jgi:hypothetical protein
VENTFKSKLENYSEQPPQAVWNKIQEKRTPVYIWWNAFKLRGWKYAASIILLMVSAVTVYFNNSNNKDQVQLNPKAGATQNEIVLNNNNSVKNKESVNDIAPKEDALNTSTYSEKELTNTKSNNISKTKIGKSSSLNRKAISKSGASEVENSNTPTQRNAFDRLYLTKLTINAFFNNKVYNFYPNLLPYADLTTLVISIVEPDKENNKRTSKWYAEMSAGPMLASRTLKGDASLKDLRDNSERAQLGWNINTKFGRTFDMHWELESGLQLMQRRENLNYNYDYTTLDQSLKITDVKIYHPNLDPKYVQVVDTVYQIRTQNVNRNQNNTYTYLSIPLIARYNFYFPKAWSVNAAAGLLTDVYQTNKGAVMANTRESVAINSIAKSTQFNQRILVSAGVKLKASEHWSILAEPVAIFGVNNMMTPGYSLKQKEFGLMFNTGLRYNF